MISFVTPVGQMVVEVPLKLETGTVEDLIPKIVETKEGTKRVEMLCTLPAEINPEKVEITCKDRDIIIKGEDTQEKPDSVSRFHYYKR